MQLVLARRRGHAETWAREHGVALRRDWRRLRSDSTVYVDTSTQLHGRTLTSDDTVVVLDGFEQRANRAQILQAIEIASHADPNGGPTWETR